MKAQQILEGEGGIESMMGSSYEFSIKKPEEEAQKPAPVVV